MPFLNLDLDYFDHPKTKRLVGLLGRGAAELPIRLWCYCGKYHAESGSLTNYSPQEIESIAGWWGKIGDMILAMERVELLEKDGDGWKVKDWKEINGHLAAFKIRARKAARKRWGMLKQSPSNSQVIHKQSPSRTLLSNQPTLTNQPTNPPNPPFTPSEAEGHFEAVWKLYPSPTGKKAALRHFLASVKTSVDLAAITAALENYKKSENVKKGYVQNGSTWFNDWEGWVNRQGPAQVKESEADRKARLLKAMRCLTCTAGKLEKDDERKTVRCSSCNIDHTRYFNA